MYTVYALCEPSSQKEMYYGCSSNLYNRYAGHLTETGFSPKHNWIKQLKNQNLKPILKEIATFEDKKKALAFEQAIIEGNSNRDIVNSIHKKGKYVTCTIDVTDGELSYLKRLAETSKLDYMEYFRRCLEYSYNHGSFMFFMNCPYTYKPLNPHDFILYDNEHSESILGQDQETRRKSFYTLSVMIFSAKFVF